MGRLGKGGGGKPGSGENGVVGDQRQPALGEPMEKGQRKEVELKLEKLRPAWPGSRPLGLDAATHPHSHYHPALALVDATQLGR